MEEVKFSFEFKTSSLYVFFKKKKYPISIENFEKITEAMNLEYAKCHAPSFSNPWRGYQLSETVKTVYLGDFRVIDITDVNDMKVVEFHRENLPSSEYPDTNKLIESIADDSAES